MKNSWKCKGFVKIEFLDKNVTSRMVCNAGEYYWFWLLWGVAARFWLRRDCQSENCLFPFRGYFPSAHQSKDVRPQWRITTKPYSLEMEKWIIEYTTAQFSSRYLNGTHLFLKWDFSLSIIDKSDFFFSSSLLVLCAIF